MAKNKLIGFAVLMIKDIQIRQSKIPFSYVHIVKDKNLWESSDLHTLCCGY